MTKNWSENPKSTSEQWWETSQYDSMRVSQPPRPFHSKAISLQRLSKCSLTTAFSLRSFPVRGRRWMIGTLHRVWLAFGNQSSGDGKTLIQNQPWVMPEAYNCMLTGICLRVYWLPGMFHLKGLAVESRVARGELVYHTVRRFPFLPRCRSRVEVKRWRVSKECENIRRTWVKRVCSRFGSKRLLNQLTG